MVINEDTLTKIKKKARLYDAAKDKIITRIRGDIETAMRKLKAAERELLEEVDIEFGENPFSDFLVHICTGNLPSEDKVQSILSIEIPQAFGPSEEAFFSLCQEIEAFKSWQKKEETEKMAEFSKCVWNKCPDSVNENRKYNVDEKNPRIAIKSNDYSYGTIIGNTPIPLNTMISWNIKVLKSKGNNGWGINIGIAPNDINQSFDNYKKCGWHFYCGDSTLWSGPPHNYRSHAYGPRKEEGQYVHTEDSVGVVVDTTKGKLSFVLNGVDLGVAYEGIPLDKPLVPCVLLRLEGDSVELII